MTDCKNGRHDWQTMGCVGRYPEITSIYWCPDCGSKRELVNRYDEEKKKAVLVRESVVPPKILHKVWGKEEEKASE